MSLRDGPFSDIKVPLIWTASVAVIVAAVLAVAILVGDRRETLQSQAYSATKDALAQVAAPAGAVISAPVRWTGGGLAAVRGYFFAVTQNEQLRRQNIELSQYRDLAISLQNENQRLRTLLGVQTDPPIPSANGLTVLESHGPFGDSRLINVGSDHGVDVGNPVISEHGVVGRVVGVSRGASRVLLLTDIASKTPVLVARTNARAILTGDGGPNPKLAYLRGDNPVQQGDRILTSGDGGLYPRGLPVGIAVMGLDGAWRVRLDSDFAPIDFVKVLLFKDFEQLADQKALAASTPPPLPAPQAQAIKALEQPAVAAAPTPIGAPTPVAGEADAPAAGAAPAAKPEAKSGAKPSGKPAAKPAAKPAKPAHPAEPAATP